MKTNIGTSKSLGSSWDVWVFLKKQGGLDIDFYDVDLVQELRTRLSLPANEDFETHLKTGQISIEKFIMTFFQTIQPYAEMMVDLLKMFEKAGANRTDRNMVIKFNFDQDLSPLTFDLEHFRIWLDAWKRLKGKYLTNVWTANLLWSLNSAFRSDVWKTPLRDAQATRWISEYRERRSWPQFTLSVPISEDPDLDELLDRTWRVWQRVVAESSKYGPDRDNLRDLAFGRRSNVDSVDLENNEDDPWPVRLLGGIDSDYWASSIVAGAYSSAEIIAQLPPSERRRRASELAARLSEVFMSLPKVEMERDELLHELQEYLQLPSWQRRHELYSAWISTQLVNALDSASLRIHHIDGALIFSFSGTHLATADNFDPHLHIWAELRSPLADPIGKGRKHSIQPDYSLITDPVTSPEASILEVECKQYRRPSKINFTNALSDYARGRPNAFIVLVNYGKADESMLSAVDDKLRNRVAIIGEMRPGSSKAQSRFKELVDNAVYGRFGTATGSKSKPSIIELDTVGTISLTWGGSPRDLDLHLRLEMNSEIDEISFSNRGSLTEQPWAELDRDDKEGFGSESITVQRWIDDNYWWFVHNYSGEVPLASCGARVLFTCGDQEYEFICPNDGAGNWWSLFKLDGQTGRIEVENKIIDRLP